jgi:hypothetical protein
MMHGQQNIKDCIQCQNYLSCYVAACCAFDSELSVLILQQTIHTVKVEGDTDVVSAGVATGMETVYVPSEFHLTKAEPEVGIFRLLLL